ncbi:ATPase F1 complex OSCP/delta subunit [Dacryopinax primogenitus]|uniref:ATP synthase subunit 5, mitochondrial n=1 Tax=Dacryopinax primogenitus (strain DJM 731) TaxID=1858805 RepID=M5G8F5_DACPD|nr:ATPase F1 complex OSCP/delta subunit [Dacryopinax primogenitus]EJU04440.1 ATPase F1 complex OSCP/delta subunit [Dacryopinax primogenitus]
MLLTSAARPAAHVISTTLQRRAASQIAIKYAQAAYGAALKVSPATLSKVQTDLAGIVTQLPQQPQLLDLIQNPTLSAGDRKKGLDQLWGTRKDADKITKNLLEVMSENGRLGELEGVSEEFKELVNKYKGELEVIVTSDKPLTPEIMKRLENAMKASQAAKDSKTLKVSNKVNPGILGGLIVEFGDKTIDLSVSNRVNRLNALLQESV